MNTINKETLKDALHAAGKAHGEYEKNYLNGVYDDVWPGWYAAYVLGRTNDFVAPSVLTAWLEAASMEGDWYENASQLVMNNLSNA